MHWEDKPKVVYFIRSKASGLIKIGITSNLKGKIALLRHQGGSEVDILLTVPGERRDESLIHRMFRASRVLGEWFKPDQDLVDCIAELSANPSFAPLWKRQPRKVFHSYDPNTVSITQAMKILRVSRKEIWTVLNSFKLTTEHNHWSGCNGRLISKEVMDVLEMIFKLRKRKRVSHGS